ncbi:MAG TPA: hypothetical protein PLD47_00375 [Aggregatilineales bacterium]|nr:hypothetical protein [Anaerolineales bacterium]HRE46153.1 hypothetical protein [Aggregatilineales bacterium]
MRNGWLPRLLVIVFALIVYLLLLPLEFSGGIRFPPFIAFDGTTFIGEDPINWRYVLLIPVVLIIIFVGFEIIRILERNPKK